jgi:hypothetical protein
MLTAPQQDWSFYADKSRSSDAAWLRTLSVADRFALYKSMFNALWNARANDSSRDRLDRWSWQQKLELQLQQVDAFARLDRLRHERSAANNAG